MKECSICSADIESLTEPALLFVGRSGRRYEICKDCEVLMDKFVADEGERAVAADKLYQLIFSGRKSPELLNFFQNLFTEDSDVQLEAEESLREYREEEKEKEESSENPLSDEANALAENDEPTEEEFLAENKPKTSLATKIIFLLLFLLLGGGTLAFGIYRASVFTIVVGAMIILLGIGSIFAKD